tara:strand:+ start:133 stop:318 length:186 start_codon:yes stop_codon:yes gene_type:complete
VLELVGDDAAAVELRSEYDLAPPPPPPCKPASSCRVSARGQMRVPFLGCALLGVGASLLFM